MDRVQLLNQRQWRGFVLAHQRAFGDQRTTDAPGNRRGDGGVAEVQFCPVDSGFVGGDIGGGVPNGDPGVVVVLAADGIAFDQLGVSLFQQLGLKRIGLGLAQRGFGAVQVSLERRRVDAEQHIALFHVTAFTEGALQDHARHAGTHFGHARCGNPPAQFAADGQWPRFDGLDANRGQRRLFLGVRGLVTRAQCQRQCNQAEPGKQILRHVIPQ
ncbi:hypothetical protein D3C87_1379620 [compost metagenome]